MKLLDEIHHIAIIVSDYEASKDFYVNKLGFEVIRESYRGAKDDWKLDLKVNENTQLEIFATKNPPKRPSYPEACGLRHLAFSVKDIEETVMELKVLGVECEPIRVDEFTDEKMTFFFDPDGLPLELHEDKVLQDIFEKNLEETELTQESMNTFSKIARLIRRFLEG